MRFFSHQAIFNEIFWQEMSKSPFMFPLNNTYSDSLNEMFF